MLPGPRHVPTDCRVIGEILMRIGDKWSMLIVMLLENGPCRFNEIRRIVGGISQRMLSLTLKRLERDGFVRRTVYPTLPPTVEYVLTDLGHALACPVKALGGWARDHQAVIMAARARYDGERSKA